MTSLLHFGTRNHIAGEMSNALNGIAFHHASVDEDHVTDLTERGEQLLGEMDDLAANPLSQNT